MDRTHWRALLWLLAAALIAPASANAAECRPLTRVTAVPLTLDAGQRPLIPISISGSPRFLLLDTGGVVSTIAPDAVDEFGLKPRRSDITLYDVNGNQLDRIVPVPTMTIGTARGTTWLFMVEANRRGDARVVGTLAPDIIRQFDVDLDFPNKTLNLFSSDHCPGRFLYWRPRAIAVLPFDVAQSGHIIVPVTLDGERLRALVDTGAPQTTLSADVATRRFRLDVNAAPGDTALSRGVHQFEKLTLQDITIANPRVDILTDRMGKAMPFNPGSLLPADEKQGLPDLIIGQSLLSRYHVYIAYGERTLYITDVSAP